MNQQNWRGRDPGRGKVIALIIQMLNGIICGK